MQVCDQGVLKLMSDELLVGARVGHKLGQKTSLFESIDRLIFAGCCEGTHF